MSRRTERRRIFAKRYKTELCSAFMDTGVCQFAHKCVFAHGLHELRTEEDNVAQGLTSDEIVDRITSVQPSVAKSTPTSRDGTASKGKPASSPTSGRHSAAARSILPTLPTNRPQPTAHAQPPTPTEPQTTSPTTTVTALVLSSKQDLVILSPHSSPKTPLSVKSILDQSNNGTTSSASSRTDSVSMFAPTSPSTSTAHHPYDASAGANARTYFSGATEVRVRRHNPYAPLPSASVQ